MTLRVYVLHYIRAIHAATFDSYQSRDSFGRAVHEASQRQAVPGKQAESSYRFRVAYSIKLYRLSKRSSYYQSNNQPQ